jgi:hypothetical protein
MYDESRLCPRDAGQGFKPERKVLFSMQAFDFLLKRFSNY